MLRAVSTVDRQRQIADDGDRDVHLHTPALQTGTHFLLTLEIIVFLFHTSKPFSSLSTRLAHAARLGFFLQKRAI